MYLCHVIHFEDDLKAVKPLGISEEFRERNFALMQKSIKSSLIYFINPKKGERRVLEAKTTSGISESPDSA